MELPKYTKMVPEAVNHWRSADTGQVFDQESIYDYMNGAAEIYKQYAFVELFVRRYDKPGKPTITVEIFKLAISQDAFGIFSHIRSGKEAEFGQDSDDTGGALNFWKSRYFVYISSEEETIETRETMFELANFIEQAIGESGARPDLLEYLPQNGLVQNEIRYVRSFILLNMHYFIAVENILNIDSETEAVLALYQTNGDENYLLIIRYPSAEQASLAKSKFIRYYMPEASESQLVQTENGKWCGVYGVAQYLIIVFDAPSEIQAHKILTSVNLQK